MTARKSDIALSARLTAYVTREEGAAELRISPSTWDELVDSGQIPKRVPANSRIGSIAHRGPNEWPVAKTRSEPPITNRGSVAFIKRAREMVHRPVHLPSEPHEPSTAHIETILRGRLLKYPYAV